MRRVESDLNILAILNSISLNTSELLRVIRATTKVHEGGRHRRVAIAAIRNFRGRSKKAAAVIIRLRALAKMVEKNELRPWVLAGEAEFSPAIAHPALISAAAQHPLYLVNGDFAFERESFLRRVLELAKPEGPIQ